ncbi:MAG TPA: MerR family transcriptional regulator [Candidatus Baltobacteraceae bacterium]|nr:MerR family transcriptional regulator [Candidatus Baltobacteraceae bacterium]
MQIGDLARRAGISLRTVRYYEERGLIEPATRSKGGFRLYEENELRKLHLIRSLQLLDMPLAEVKRFFDERNRGRVGSEVAPGLQEILRNHLAEVEHRIAEYQATRTSVRETLQILTACASCPLEPGPAVCLQCPVLVQRETIPAHMQAIIDSTVCHVSDRAPADAAEPLRVPVGADHSSSF